MPEWKMIEQVFKGEYLQFFFEHISPERTNAFEVFYWIG
jgi:hypothetical protein